MQENIVEEGIDNTTEAKAMRKVMISDELYRKLKAVGTFFENELDNTKEAFVVGKGIEKAYIALEKDGLVSIFK